MESLPEQQVHNPRITHQGHPMSAKASWTATVAGTAVGTGGWIFGLGRLIWPAHPQWALFFLTLAVTVFAMIVAEREVRRKAAIPTAPGARVH